MKDQETRKRQAEEKKGKWSTVDTIRMPGKKGGDATKRALGHTDYRTNYLNQRKRIQVR